MVSKLNAVFRHFIGSDNQRPTPGSRKRSSESFDNVTQDVLETPQAKRARTSHGSDDTRSSSSSSTPLLKVAKWIRQKASSFGENYFFRPVGNGVDRAYHVVWEEPATSNSHQTLPNMSRAPIHRSSESSISGTSGGEKKKVDQASFKQPGEPPHRKQLHVPPATNRFHPKPRPTLHNGHPEETDGMDRVRQGISGVEPRNQPTQTSKSFIHSSNSLSSSSGSRSKPESYVPVQDKLFPKPRRRVVISNTSRSHLPRPNSKLTVNECVRLKEKQQYQELLQQYTMGYTAQSSRLAGLDTTSRPSEALPKEAATRQKTNSYDSGLSATSSTSTHEPIQPSQLGMRVLPHKFSTQREIREAVRQRIHAPVSHLSPGSPTGERPQHATPAQPDFSGSDSPIITAIEPAPKTKGAPNTPLISAFERSLCATPYLSDDWVKDLKSRFESSVRVRQREIEDQRTKLQLFEERRAKEQAEAQEHIKARITKAEKEPAVIEDVICIDEEEEKEEELEVISDEEEEEEEDEVEEEDLPELTPEMEDEIEDAFNPNPPAQSLSQGYKLNITRRDMHTLAGLNWLNDEVMNFYFEMLMERSNKENYPSVHAFNTFFYPKLVNSGYNSIRRWTKRTDIFAKDIVLVPVHLGMHWCLAVIDFRKKSIVFYDSMGSINQQCLDVLRDYVVSEHADKKKQEYSMEGWTYHCERNIPQQMNGSDCGMFACKYAEYISREAPITFTQHHMPYFRRRMVWEILHKTLL